ncbi:MAG: hypothetical protein ACPL5F_13550, partial [Moorellaceae bacterium]
FPRLKFLNSCLDKGVHLTERAGELRKIYLNVDKAARDLGWQPQVSLEEGLKRTVEHLRKAGDSKKNLELAREIIKRYLPALEELSKK